MSNPNGEGGACTKPYTPLKQAEDVDPGSHCCNNHFNICINICILCFSDILTIAFIVISVLQILFVILAVIHLVILSFVLIIVFTFLNKHVPKGGMPKGGKGNVDKAAGYGDKD